MTTCLIALGGNVGDVPGAFSLALARLADEDARVVAVSRLVRSAPMGGAAGGDFLNAAARVETSLAPAAMLARLHEIEAGLNRRRQTRWGPRTIDLDLITYGTIRSETPELMLPHPGCWWRRFVLDPLVEIAGEEIHPAAGESFFELRERLLARPFVVGIAETIPPSWTTRISERLGVLGEMVEWTISESPATIQFVPGSTINAPTKRLLGAPDDEEGFVEFATAVLTAAVDEPVVVGEGGGFRFQGSGFRVQD